MATVKLEQGQEVREPELCAADNGFILNYSTYAKDPNSTYDGLSYVGRKQLVFSYSEKEKALNAFIELCVLAKKLSAVETKTETEEEEE